MFKNCYFCAIKSALTSVLTKYWARTHTDTRNRESQSIQCVCVNRSSGFKLFCFFHHLPVLSLSLKFGVQRNVVKSVKGASPNKD